MQIVNEIAALILCLVLGLSQKSVTALSLNKGSVLPSRDDSGPVQVVSSGMFNVSEEQDHNVTCIQPGEGISAVIQEDCEGALGKLDKLPYKSKPIRFLENKYYDPDSRPHVSSWTKGKCSVYVRSRKTYAALNIKPDDVIATARRVLSQCVQGQQPLYGGTTPLGDRPSSRFYVGISSAIPNGITNGTGVDPDPSSDANSTSSAPDEAADLEDLSRADEVQQNNSTTPTVLNSTTQLGFYDVDCHPDTTRLDPINDQDCEWVVVNQILQAGPQFSLRTWGYPSTANFPLPQTFNHHRCQITVDNDDRTALDTFSLLEVGNTARRTVRKCEMDRRGGESGIGNGKGMTVDVRLSAGSPLSLASGSVVVS